MAIKKLKEADELNKDQEVDNADASVSDPIQDAIDKLKNDKRDEMSADDSADDEVAGDEDTSDEDTGEDAGDEEVAPEDDVDDEELDEADEDITDVVDDGSPALNIKADDIVKQVAEKIAQHVNIDNGSTEEVTEEDEVKNDADTEEVPADVDADSDEVDTKEVDLDPDSEDEGEGEGEDVLSADDIDTDEDVDALTKDEELTEAFKAKAKTIFKAAVLTKSNIVINEAIKILKKKYATQVSKLEEQYTNKINDYLNVIVENWTKDNSKILTENAKQEFSQSFMTGLKSLFESHNVDIPQNKIDVVNRLVEENIKMEDQLNKLISEKVTLINEMKNEKRAKILSEAVVGLSINQGEKLKLLSEAVDFVSEKDFRNKINEVKSAYFVTKAPKKRSIEKDLTPIPLNEKTELFDDEVSSVVNIVTKSKNL